MMKAFGYTKEAQKVGPMEYASQYLGEKVNNFGGILNATLNATFYQYIKDNLEPFLSSGLGSIVTGVGALFAGKIEDEI